MSSQQDNSTTSYVLPPQMIPVWTDEDYIRCIRSIANNWNYDVHLYNPNAIDFKELGLPLRFADRCFWWSEYYFGRQRNIDFDSLLLRADGKRRAIKMFRGKDVKKFVDDQVGALYDTIKSFPDILGTKGVSDNIVSKRSTQLNIQKYLMDQQVGAGLQQILAQFGMYVQTVTGQKSLADFGEQTSSIGYVESLESAVVNIGKDFLYRNYWLEQYTEAAKNSYICGLGAAKIDVVNGYPMLDVFPSYEAIAPPRSNGDQHRSDPYGGRIRFLTVQEICALYPQLGKEKLKEIESLAYTQDQTLWKPWNITYNAGSSIVWWAVRDGVPRVAVVDVQWASYDAKEGETYRQANRQGVLIGNKYLVNQGLVSNQTKDWRNPSHTNLDFLFVRPMSIFGQNMGIPETIYSYVNQIDAWQTKINDWVAKAKGNTYVMFTKSLPEGVDAQTIISDLADDGLHVSEGHDIDYGDTTRSLPMQPIPMELPASVVNLMSQIQIYRQMMADILNIPDTARGQIKGYQPTKNVEASIINSSKGTSTFTVPLNTYFLRLIQKGVDKFCSASLTNPNIEYSLIVGDTQMMQLKVNQDVGLSKFAMYLDFDDMMDEQSRKETEGMIFAYAQNSQQTGYTLGDLFAIRNMSTKSEVQSYLEFREAEIERQRQQQATMQMQAEAQKTQEINQTQENITAANIQSTNAREAAKIESKEKIEAAKIEADLLLSKKESQEV